MTIEGLKQVVNDEDPGFSNFLKEVKRRMFAELKGFRATHDKESVTAYKMTIAGLVRLEYLSLKNNN